MGIINRKDQIKIVKYRREGNFEKSLKVFPFDIPGGYL
jgi:hypothetical protein